MIAMVNLYDNASGQLVARMIWDGDLYEGTARFEDVAAGADKLGDVMRLLETQKQLRVMRFRSVGARDSVHGWQGFEGTTGALRVAVPAEGLRVGQCDPTDLVLSELRAVQHERRMEERAVE